MKFAFIKANSSEFSVKKMCHVLEVSRSGYHAWVNHTPSVREIENKSLLEEIKTIHQENRQCYGSPRITKELHARGQMVGENRVAGIMKKNKIAAENKRKFRVQTTDSRHDLPISPNLLEQNFHAARPNEIWLSDITYVPAGNRWAYLCAFKDLCTMEIVGWAMADHMRAELVIEALAMALKRRTPLEGLIVHSDRGVQYASQKFRAELDLHGFRSSMSRKGDCYDNAPMESFFGSLKVEEVYKTKYMTLEEARIKIFDYIECFYNRKRRHSSLGYVSPIEYLNKVDD
jgi:transposase InsO family protein